MPKHFPAPAPSLLRTPRRRSSNPEHLALIEKIRHYQSKNEELQAKGQTLQSTVKCSLLQVYDLRKLLQLTAIESEDYFKEVEASNGRLE
jgi:hypothetical protein